VSSTVQDEINNETTVDVMKFSADPNQPLCLSSPGAARVQMTQIEGQLFQLVRIHVAVVPQHLQTVENKQGKLCAFESQTVGSVNLVPWFQYP
jgi:hypothetical protein